MSRAKLWLSQVRMFDLFAACTWASADRIILSLQVPRQV